MVPAYYLRHDYRIPTFCEVLDENWCVMSRIDRLLVPRYCGESFGLVTTGLSDTQLGDGNKNGEIWFDNERSAREWADSQNLRWPSIGILGQPKETIALPVSLVDQYGQTYGLFLAGAEFQYDCWIYLGPTQEVRADQRFMGILWDTTPAGME